MTRELVLMSLDGQLFGAWRTEVREIKPVRAASRLTVGGSTALVATILDGKMTILCNVAACLGLSAAAEIREGSALMAAGDGPVAGFFCAGETKAAQVEDGQELGIPASARSSAIRTCALVDGEVTPIVDLQALLQGQREPQPSRGRADGAEPREIRVAVLDGVPVAIGGDRVEAVSSPPRPPRTLPLAPEGVGGAILVEDRLVVLPRAMGEHEPTPESRLVVADIDGDSYGVWADSAGEPLRTASCRVEPLPPLLARPWIGTCAVALDAAVPLLDLRVLVAEAGRESSEKTAHYELGSDFPKRFLREPVEVVEVDTGGLVYAIPGNEVTEIMTLPWVVPMLDVGTAHASRRGVALHEGQPLPVLGLSAGAIAAPGREGSTDGVVVRNGDFACIVTGADVRDRRTIAVDVQRALPIPPPNGSVYGCYVHDDGVILILNVAAVAASGDDGRLQGAPRPAPTPEAEAGEDRWASWRPTAREGCEAAQLRAQRAPTAEAAGESQAEEHAEATTVEMAPAEELGAAAAPSPAAPAEHGASRSDGTAHEAEKPVSFGMSLTEEPDLVPSFESAGTVTGRAAKARGTTAATKPRESRPRKAGRWWIAAAAAAVVVTLCAVFVPRLLKPPAQAQAAPAREPAAAAQPATESRQVPAPAAPAPAAAPTTPPTTAPATPAPAAATPARAPIASTPEAVERVIVVYFAADSAAITPAAERLLGDAASTIAGASSKPVAVTLTGHTAMAETAELRWRLSLRRAEAVRDYLARTLPAGSFTAECAGLGAEKPAAPNDTEENMRLNRRVVVRVSGGS